MAISGRLQDLSFADLLEFIASGRRAGILSVITGVQTARLVFVDGRLVYASSDQLPRLGACLVEKDLVLGDDVEQALQLQVRGGGRKPLGTLLLENHLISRDVLEQEVVEHIRRVIASLVGWEDGSWNFEVREVPPEYVVPDGGLDACQMLDDLTENDVESANESTFDRELWP